MPNTNAGLRLPVETCCLEVYNVDDGASPFNALPESIIFANVTGGLVTILLPNTPPISPEDGDIVEVYDAFGNSEVNNVTIDGNGNNISGLPIQTLNYNYSNYQIRWSQDAGEWQLMMHSRFPDVIFSGTFTLPVSPQADFVPIDLTGILVVDIDNIGVGLGAELIVPAGLYEVNLSFHSELDTPIDAAQLRIVRQDNGQVVALTNSITTPPGGNSYIGNGSFGILDNTVAPVNLEVSYEAVAAAPYTAKVRVMIRRIHV